MNPYGETATNSRRGGSPQPMGQHGITSHPAFAGNSDYYAYVAAGYDRTAASYDQVEGANSISERVRRVSLATAQTLFVKGERVLELGCGTGRDAVALARDGIRVVATDVSPEMISITRARMRREGVEHLVTAEVLPAARAVLQGGPYDGVYSNGAVLNLEPELREVAQGLSKTVRQGACAVFTAANRLSLFELAVYPLALRPRKAFRKLNPTVPIPISRRGIGKTYVVPTQFLTPREFISLFTKSFELKSLKALQVVTPPWNFVDLAARFRSAVDTLERIEDRIGGRRLLRNLGAIYLTILRRKED